MARQRSSSGVVQPEPHRRPPAFSQSPRLALVSVLVCALLPPASPFVALQPFSCNFQNLASRRGGLAGSLVCRSAPKGYAVVTEGDGDTQNLVIGNREGRRKWARTSGITSSAAAILSTTTRRTHAEGNEDLELPVLLTWDQKLRNLLCDLKVRPWFPRFWK
jgi:hypothetical protein